MNKEVREEIEEVEKNYSGLERMMRINAILDRAYYKEKEKIYGKPGIKQDVDEAEKFSEQTIPEETVSEEGMEKESIYNLTKKVQSVPQEERENQIKTMEALEEFLAVYKDILAGNASYGEIKNLEEGKDRLQENIEKAQSFLSEWLMG